MKPVVSHELNRSARRFAFSRVGRRLCKLPLLLVLLGCFGCDAPENTEGPSTPAASNPSAAELVHPEVLAENEDSGVEFTHHRGAKGDFRLEEIMSGGVALFDFDLDQDFDLFLVHGDPLEGSFGLFLNSGDGSFSDHSLQIEAQATGFGMGAAAGDFDGDGWVDLYLTSAGPDLLLGNDRGERLTDVTAVSGLGDDGYGSSAVWFDADNDGDLDLYVARYIDRDSPAIDCRHSVTNQRDYCNPLSYRPDTDRLYRNDGGRFADRSEPSGISLTAGYGLAVMCSDFDLNGTVDVLVANDQTPALLWNNDGEWNFVDVALARGCAYDQDGRAIAGMGIVSEDFDGDSDLDLFLTNIREQDNVFYALENERYTDVSRRWGEGKWLLPYTGFGVAAFDQDHDGSLDMYIANGAVAARVGNLAESPYAEPDSFLRYEDTRFVDASWNFEPDLARGVARGDLDADGDIDLVVCRNGGVPRLLFNRAANQNHWLIVSVVDAMGRQILNSRVELHAAGRTWVTEIRAQESYLSSRDPRAHFGLGQVAMIERLVLRLPDGSTRELREIASNQVLVIETESPPQSTEQR